MDDLISGHVAWNNWTEWRKNMLPWWTTNFVYDTVTPFPHGGNYTGLRDWYLGEHIPYNEAFWPCKFNQMIFAGDDTTATTTTYANAFWRGQLGPMKPINKSIVIRILDFYKLVEDPEAPAGGRISYNWMMIDFAHVKMQQRGGRSVLPPAVLPEEGWVQGPAGLDGQPAPTSFTADPADAAAGRTIVQALLASEWAQQAGPSPAWAAQLVWYGPVGFGVARSLADYKRGFVDVMYKAFRNVQLQIDVISCEGRYCGAHGHFVADHVGPFLGQAPTHERIRLRFGCHWHVVAGQIVEGWTIFDLPGLFLQFGVDLLAERADDFDEDRGTEVAAMTTTAMTMTKATSTTTTAAQTAGVQHYNNSCLADDAQLSPPTKNAPTTFLADCPSWVVRTTDQTWHASLAESDAAVDTFFSENFTSTTDGGVMVGREALRAAIKSKRAAFPDLRIHITDAVCHGNDIDGYKTIMPDVVTGTNGGSWPQMGIDQPTNRSTRVSGLFMTLVQRAPGNNKGWQYVAEWGLHDGQKLALQLGIRARPTPDPAIHDCKANKPSWGGWRLGE
eukprot:g587.t1